MGKSLSITKSRLPQVPSTSLIGRKQKSYLVHFGTQWLGIQSQMQDLSTVRSATPHRAVRGMFFLGGNGEGETRWQEGRYPFGGDWGKGVREVRTKVSLDEKILSSFNVFIYLYIYISNLLWILKLIYSQPMHWKHWKLLLKKSSTPKLPAGQQDNKLPIPFDGTSWDTFILLQQLSGGGNLWRILWLDSHCEAFLIVKKTPRYPEFGEATHIPIFLGQKTHVALICQSWNLPLLMWQSENWGCHSYWFLTISFFKSLKLPSD